MRLARFIHGTPHCEFHYQRLELCHNGFVRRRNIQRSVALRETFALFRKPLDTADGLVFIDLAEDVPPSATHDRGEKTARIFCCNAFGPFGGSEKPQAVGLGPVHPAVRYGLVEQCVYPAGVREDIVGYVGETRPGRRTLSLFKSLQFPPRLRLRPGSGTELRRIGRG